jgi:DNA repair protein RecO (recombination protein O)
LQLAKGHDMPLVTQADTVDTYLPLRENLQLTGQASYVVELLDRFTYDDATENPIIFALLIDTLSRLASGVDPWLAIRYYEMRLLDNLGFRPKLFECAQGGQEILAEDQFFSFAAGGVVCPSCGRSVPNLRQISVEALKYLRHFQRSTYSEAARARALPEVRQETEELMHGYFTYLLERELKTPGFLRQIKA